MKTTDPQGKIKFGRIDACIQSLICGKDTPTDTMISRHVDREIRLYRDSSTLFVSFERSLNIWFYKNGETRSLE